MRFLEDDEADDPILSVVNLIDRFEAARAVTTGASLAGR